MCWLGKKSNCLGDDSPSFTLCMEKITMTSDNRVKIFSIADMKA